MKNLLRTLLAATLLLGLPCLYTNAARAQDASPTEASTAVSDADLGESAAAVRQLQSVSPKLIVFVFDVSGSMRGELLRRAREATINIIREGTKAGDRIVLYTFGSDYQQVFDKTLASEADKKELIDLVPNQPGTGAGTNIRKPHHEALKLLEANLPHPGAVVLLTDSFNDEPKKDDTAYPTYLQYYLPGGRLNRYPDTPENRDYERLLKEMSRSQKVKIFGIGVQIDQSGRPVERLPQAAPSPVAVADQPTTTTPVAEVGGKQNGSLLPYILGGVGALALIAGLVYFLGSSKPLPVRIAGGPGGPKEFELRSGQTISLGGPAAHAFDAYGLPETKAPVAVLRGSGGGRMSVALAPAEPNAPAPKVFHNGLPLERETPLSYGDEVRIALPDATGVGIAKEYRLKFDDPTKSF